MDSVLLNNIIKFEEVNSSNFMPYGGIIDFSAGNHNERFEVVIFEETQPWRIAMYRETQKSIARLEAHLESIETFEPVKGIGVLVVSHPDLPNEIKGFLITKPIYLNKGIWHNVISLTSEVVFKITENKEVESVFHELDCSLRIL